MNQEDVIPVKAELDAFVDDVFASLPRTDQRAKGNLYLRGLMLDGRRKSMQPMGERLGIDHQQLQQFVSASPCVARQYSGTLDKIGNCQIGVRIHAATDAASCPLGWRLLVPEA
jgi:SRSO17 transposase